MWVVWLGRLGFGLIVLAFGVSAAFFLASFGDASWVNGRGQPLMTQLSTLFYGASAVAMLLNLPLAFALTRVRRLFPPVRSVIPYVFRPLWPVGIVVLVGFALLLGAMYVNRSWVMPPLDDTKDALARFTESGATRNLRTMTLGQMGWLLFWPRACALLALPVC